jgi:hypothetical protein
MAAGARGGPSQVRAAPHYTAATRYHYQARGKALGAPPACRVSRGKNQRLATRLAAPHISCLTRAVILTSRPTTRFVPYRQLEHLNALVHLHAPDVGLDATLWEEVLTSLLPDDYESEAMTGEVTDDWEFSLALKQELLERETAPKTEETKY